MLSCLFFLVSGQVFSKDLTDAPTDDSTVKAVVGTQTYQCTLNPNLSCKAVNELQKKEIVLKKNGGQVSLVDSARNLSADISTTLDGVNVVYDITLCSGLACSISTVTTNAAGSINQVMSGQYNITEKSFFVLGAFISNQKAEINLEEKVLHSHKL